MLKYMHRLFMMEFREEPHGRARATKERPVKGMVITFYADRGRAELAGIQMWLTILNSHPLDWVKPSRDAWAIDLDCLKHYFEANPDTAYGYGSLPVQWPSFFTGSVDVLPEWETVPKEEGSNRLNFYLHEDEIVSAKAAPKSKYREARVGDVYNIHGPAIAVGPNATAYKSAATQNNGAKAEIDLAALTIELEKLRAAVAQHAQEAEEQVQVGVVAAASIAAKNGEREKVMSYISQMGKWTLGVAEKIGVGVATKLIMQAIG